MNKQPKQEKQKEKAENFKHICFLLSNEHELITVPIGLHSPFQLKVPEKLDNTYSDDKNGYMFNLQIKTYSQ